MSKREIEKQVDGLLTDELPVPPEYPGDQGVYVPEPEPELEPELELDDEPIPIAEPAGARDFRDVAMRRVDGALAEIVSVAGQLLEEIEDHRSNGNWDLEPEELDSYKYRVDMLGNMVGRLENPHY